MLCSVVCVYNDHRSDCECFTYQLIVLCLPIQLSLPCGTVAESCTLLLYQLSRCYALPVEGAGDTPQEGGTSLPGPLCFASFLLLRCVGFPGSLLHPCEWLSEFFRHHIWLPVGSRALWCPRKFNCFPFWAAFWKVSLSPQGTVSCLTIFTCVTSANFTIWWARAPLSQTSCVLGEGSGVCFPLGYSASAPG